MTLRLNLKAHQFLHILLIYLFLVCFYVRPCNVHFHDNPEIDSSPITVLLKEIIEEKKS